MKSFSVLAATFAGVALAQNTMPTGDCSLLCINNMAKIAETEFSCGANDLNCFCTKSNWAYGIRDCSRQACDAAQADAAITWAYARCAGIAATASGTPDALPILTSAVASITASAGDSAASGVASVTSSAASAASSFASSVASGADSVTSSLASETSALAESASSAISSAAASASDALASATNSIKSELSSATASAGSALSSATGAAASAASSAASAASSAAQGAAAQATAMPFMAGAGVVAWLLL